MAVLALDLGGTKLAGALFSDDGKLLYRKVNTLNGRQGNAVCELIQDSVTELIDLQKSSDPISSIGVCVPGIYNKTTHCVWAPNIAGWDNYPLLEEIEKCSLGVPVYIDSDRSCSILGEVWQGSAKDCKDAIFVTVGTGIGAGIMANGRIIRGVNDIAGAIGWLALSPVYCSEYEACGHFEYYASGSGIARYAKRLIAEEEGYSGSLSTLPLAQLRASDVFSAYLEGDLISQKVLKQSIRLWGMAMANLVSIFNPEVIIFGGGLFGPATQFLSNIEEEAQK